MSQNVIFESSKKHPVSIFSIMTVSLIALLSVLIILFTFLINGNKLPENVDTKDINDVIKISRNIEEIKGALIEIQSDIDALEVKLPEIKRQASENSKLLINIQEVGLKNLEFRVKEFISKDANDFAKNTTINEVDTSFSKCKVKIVVARSLFVRSEPDGSKIGGLKSGDKVCLLRNTAIEKSGETWVRIKGDSERWVADSPKYLADKPRENFN